MEIVHRARRATGDAHGVVFLDALARAFRRRREIALRLAMGVGRRRLVLGQGLRFAAAGVAVGAALALAGGRRAAPLLFDVSPRDPVVFGAVGAALLGVALVASMLPALRALRADPGSALRAE